MTVPQAFKMAAFNICIRSNTVIPTLPHIDDCTG